MLVGDPHEKNFTESPDVLARIKDYLVLQYEAVNRLKPDLVVLLGDNASSSTPEGIREILLRITEPYVRAGVPFTFILGNHDLESKISDLDEHYSIYKSLPGIVFPDEYSKNGDYYLTVRASNDSDDVLNLWYIYNGAHPDNKYHSHYSSVSAEQIEWYEKNAEKLKKNGKPLPSIVFQHVPVSEEYALAVECSPAVMLTDGVSGLDGRKGKYFHLKKNTEGYMGEAPCTADYNCGQFASWLKTGDVFAAFFGHDHMNDFCGPVSGITLGQCKTSSFRVYGDGMMQGVRIVDLDENNVRDLKTEMVYYRDLIGSECRSLHGTEKVLHDRTSVKLDVLKAVSKVVVPMAAPILTYKLIKRSR